VAERASLSVGNAWPTANRAHSETPDRAFVAALSCCRSTTRALAAGRKHRRLWPEIDVLIEHRVSNARIEAGNSAIKHSNAQGKEIATQSSTNLCRSAANTLKTDDVLNVACLSSCAAFLGAAGGIGYATGAGGYPVHQQVHRRDAYRVTGAITTNAAALAANTTISFTLTNSAMANTDLLILTTYLVEPPVHTRSMPSAVPGLHHHRPHHRRNLE
jgi:hypothetical protein